MKVEYPEELEKLVRLHVECIIPLIKTIFNVPLHQSSRWALDTECGRWTQNLAFFPCTLHAILKKLFISGLWHLEQMAFWLLKMQAFGRVLQINCISHLRH